MIYRVSIYDGGFESMGFCWYDTKAKAKACIDSLGKEFKANTTIQSLPTPKSKRQMLSLLQSMAGHADNG